jgi:Tfp pilus assembly protein PilP
MKNLIIITTLLVLFGCTKQKEMELRNLINDIEAQVRPLNKEAALAYWNATISGDPLEFEKYSPSESISMQYAC